VVVGGSVDVVVVVVRFGGTEVVSFAPGKLGELEHADAMTASVARTSRGRSPPRSRMGVTRGQAIVSRPDADIGIRHFLEGYGMPPAHTTVRPATKGDIAEVAQLHVEAIHEGFLSSLGTAFLRRLYARLARSRHGFLLVADATAAEPDNRVIGFVGGSTNLRAFYREFVWRDGLAASLSSFSRLVRSAPRAIETLRYGNGAGPVAGDSGFEAELLAIGVSGSARRRGTGAALAQAFLEASAREGANSARVVVGSENAAAIALYERYGFAIARELELHAGSRSLIMRAKGPLRSA
jgi:ribosomal protein S18 acetylase RimI-like enzyme